MDSLSVCLVVFMVIFNLWRRCVVQLKRRKDSPLVLTVGVSVWRNGYRTPRDLDEVTVVVPADTKERTLRVATIVFRYRDPSGKFVRAYTMSVDGSATS